VALSRHSGEYPLNESNIVASTHNLIAPLDHFSSFNAKHAR
jgi:hypothetical protein